MVIYTGFFIALTTLGIVWAKAEDRLAHLIGAGILLPIVGRVMGWW